MKTKVVPRVLVADKWHTWHRLFKNLLVDEYHVESANTFEQAIKKIRHSNPPYHVIVFDVQLTVDLAQDLPAGRQSVLDEIENQGSYTKPVIAVSHGPSIDQVRTVIANYKVDARYCFEKFPPVYKYSIDEYNAFDPQGFQDTVRAAAHAAEEEKRKVDEHSGYEQLQKLARDRFHTLPILTQQSDPDLYLSLLPDLANFNRVQNQIRLAIDNLRRTFPALKHESISHIIEREQIWAKINKAALVIADLTGQDPNVFYQLGLCDALAKQMIFLRDQTQEPEIPACFDAFRRIKYDPSKWKILRLSSQLMDELIEGPPPAHPLGKATWSLAEINTNMAVALLQDPSSKFLENGSPAAIEQNSFYHCFVEPVLRLRQSDVKEISGIFSSRFRVESAWRAINQAGIILADISTSDPEILYMVGLAHAQSKPIILLTSSRQTMPVSLTDLDYFEYSLDWDSSIIEKNQAELSIRIDGILDAYNAAARADSLPTYPSSDPTQKPSSIWEEWNWQSSDGSESILPGVARDILIGLGDRLPDGKFNELGRDLICSMASSLEDRRIQSAVRLWETLWAQEVGLPHIPFMKILARNELSAEMYTEYRDHVVHSVWVYMLGLYLYECNGPIRKAVLSRMDEKDFLLAWKISALFHDIGYTCDRGIDHEEEFLRPVLDELQILTDFPLRGHLVARGFELSEKDELDLARISNRFTPKLLTLDSIEFMPTPGDEERLLKQLEPLVICTQLAQDGQETPLQSYYNLGKTVKPINRERFRDHGILSALVLLHQFHFFALCVQSLQNKPLPKSISRETRIELENMISDRRTERYSEIVHQATSAMALHNVDWRIWDIEKAKQAPHYLSLGDFRILLDQSPLAFLLALTDVLQCWDRPKRRYVDEPKELSVRNQDVHIRCVGDTIYWSVRSDRVVGRKLINPDEEIKNLSKQLKYGGQDDLGLLLKEEDFS